MSNAAVAALVEVVEKRAAEYAKAYEQTKVLRKEMREAVAMAEKVAAITGDDAPVYSEAVTEALAPRRRNKDTDDDNEENVDA